MMLHKGLDIILRLRKLPGPVEKLRRQTCVVEPTRFRYTHTDGNRPAAIISADLATPKAS